MVPRKQAGHVTCTRPQAERQILLATRASSTHDPNRTPDGCRTTWRVTLVSPLLTAMGKKMFRKWNIDASPVLLASSPPYRGSNKEPFSETNFANGICCLRFDAGANPLGFGNAQRNSRRHPWRRWWRRHPSQGRTHGSLWRSRTSLWMGRGARPSLRLAASPLNLTNLKWEPLQLAAPNFN
jgi:hypothetical protein